MAGDSKLTTVEEVVKRLDDEMDDKLEMMIEAGIEDASDEARDFGSPSWDADNVPLKVGRMVAVAVARWIRNPGGYVQSRAGDETLNWMEDPDGGKPHFTQDERERLAKIGTPHIPEFGSFEITAYSSMVPRDSDIRVPWGDTGTTFPLFRAGDVE